MKKSGILLAMAIVFAATFLNAQQNSFYIGARGGANMSKFRFTEGMLDLYPTSSAVFGMNGGLDMGLQLNKWVLSTGVHYIQKGSEYQTDNFDENGSVGYFTAKEKLHFASIPVTVGYRDYLTNNVGWSVAVGPSFNFGLDGKLDEVTEYFGTDETEVQNFKVGFGSSVNDDYKALQVGFQLSPGLFIDLNNRGKLHFNLTWDFGTSDMFNPRYKDANDFFAENKGNQIHKSTMFTIGYEYHFKFEDKY